MPAIFPAVPQAFAQSRGADLTIVDAFFEDYDRSIIREQKLRAGETLYLSFRVAGFKPDEKHRVKLGYWIDLVDPQDIRLTETMSDKIEQTLAPEDEKWRPKAEYSAVVPTYAPSGEYHVNILVRDEVAGKEVRQQMRFMVRGETIEPSETLAVRNFEFADSEDGKAKPTPAYTRGTTLWARFRVVGFRVSPDKRIHVEDDLSVLDPEGKVLFEKPQAAVENYTMYYPPRFLTASFNLELQPQVKPGDYILRLTIRDLLGKQETRHESKFTVLP